MSTAVARTVLIVDDSKVSRMVIKAHILAAHPDWQVTEAGTGEDAIDAVGRAVPDFCTMDINMPGMLGTDAAAAILQSHPQVRIAIFSANIQESVQSRVQQLGAIFVAKPVTEKSIAQALHHFSGVA
jgi:CheY-like chemotaxis protein